MNRRPGRGIRGVVALLVAAVLAGCAGIPTNGPVVPGRPMGDERREDMFGVIARGPEPGSGPEAIVIGFLRAAVGFTEDHQVARSFLTPSRRLSWQPDTSVIVYPDESSLRPVTRVVSPAPPTPTSTPAPTPTPAPAPAPEELDGAQRVSVTVTPAVDATIDAEGRYTVTPPGTTKTVDFGLVKVDGEWRIDQVADGILVDAGDFEVAFLPFPVYFPARSGTYLVPDVHWFPRTRELPTALVRALLAGPPPWLAGAVSTGVPPRTRMAVPAVVVSGRVATVDLSEEAREAGPDQRRQLARQLEATLTGLSGINRVQITVNQVDFEIPDESRPRSGPTDLSEPLRADPRVDARLVVLDGEGRLARIERGTELVPVAGVEGLAVPGAAHPAVNAEGTVYAVLGGDGRRLLIQTTNPPAGTAKAPVTVVEDAALTPPSFDPLNWVWTSPAANRGVVYVGRPGLAGHQTVKAEFLKGHEVVALRASRDGARVLVVTEHEGRAQAFVTGVLREAGRPVALQEPPLSLLPDLVTALDAAWVDEDQVVVLGTRERRLVTPQPWLLQVGGEVSSVQPAPEATSITAGNGELSLVAGTPTGVLTRTGPGWERTSGGRHPAYPG